MEKDANREQAKVNLMLSWERQGYSWMSGECTISNDFVVNEKDSGYQLSFSLLCRIDSVVINGYCIDSSSNSSGWTRGEKYKIKIPASVLKSGMVNRISFRVSDFGYTGGLSSNFCQIAEKYNHPNDSVNLTLDSSNHCYSLNASRLKLTADVESSNEGILNLVVRNDFGDTLVVESRRVDKGKKQQTFALEQYNLPAGFYESTVILSNGCYSGDVAWFTIAPESIECGSKAPADIDQYWTTALNELNSIEPQFTLQKVDSLCSDFRDGYIAEMSSVKDVSIRAYYFVPKGAGKYPAILHLPGYGNGFTYHKGFKNRKEDVIEMALCVRGHGISADKFNPWNDMTLWAYQICNLQENVYRSAYLDCVRAVDFLLSRSEVDTTRIGVLGGSQGGGLALATAALCNDKIHVCAFFDPFPCDVRDLISIRKIGQEEIQSFVKLYDNCNYEDALRVQDYVDARNLASKIRCQTLFLTALFDDDCPSHVGFSAFNSIHSKKEFKIYPFDSHMCESGEFDEMFRFVFEKLSLMQ